MFAELVEQQHHPEAGDIGPTLEPMIDDDAC